MSLHGEEDYSISISVVPPFEDAYEPYQYSPSPQTVEEEYFAKSILGNLDDVLLGPSSYAPGSPFSEGGSPATTDNSLSPDFLEALSLQSPSTYELSSGVSSPWPTTMDDLVEAQNTVSPRDIMGDTSVHSGDMMSTFFTGHHIEPLFEVETDESDTRDLIVLDEMTREVSPEAPPTAPSALFNGQKTPNLCIRIPVAQSPSQSTPIFLSPSPSPSPAVSLYSPSPGCERPASLSPVSQAVPSPSLYSPSPTPLSPSPSGSPQSTISGALRPRRRTRASSTSSSISIRHHPYGREPSAGREADQQISKADLDEIISFLRPFPEFANWDFDGQGLPPMARDVVGSKKTREASGNRRTQGGEFLCTLPGCGSSITKKHNLRHHIVSHFILHAFKCDVCHQGFGHHCSLVRHQKGSCQVADEEPRPAKHNKRSKRSRRP